MMGVRTFLNTQCGIPLTDLVGFRSPFLIHNPTVRGILAKNKILYDSSIDEYVSDSSLTSKTFSSRLYPYTFDNGIVQDCNWTLPSGQCTQNERYPGMWEVPMWDLPNATVTPQINAYTMDPDRGFGGDLLTTLKTNFDQAYNGNRAPFPIYVHAPWFTPEHINLANQFIEYALSKPNVYFVTIRQLIDWMNNPVPASQLATTLKCNPTDLSAPTPTQPCTKYTIVAGDYMDLIAGKFGVEPAAILAVNPGMSANIQPGQSIKIPPWDAICDSPGGVAAAAAAAAAGTPAAPAAAAAETVPTTTAAVAPTTAPVEPTTTTTTTPATTTNGPADRVEMEFNLKGMDASAFELQGRNNVMNILSQLLEIFPDRITVAATPVVAKRRRSTMSATTPTPVVAAAGPAPNALKVTAVIVSDDPAATYVKLDHEIKAGEFESLLNALGLTATGAPTVAAYKSGVKIEDPAATAAASGTAPAATATATASTKSSYSSYYWHCCWRWRSGPCGDSHHRALHSP
jgi:LysM repeat protein